MKTFAEIHYPRGPKWNEEKHDKREEAYMLSILNGPKMGEIFHIRKPKCDQAFCGISARDHDIDHDASAIAWTDSTGQLHVVCTSCHENRLPGPDPDQLDTMELIQGLQSSGLNVQTIDEHTDFNTLKFWDHFPTERSDS